MPTNHSHIIIISHRRSGTHLIIDAILNNFKKFRNSHLLTFRQLVPGWHRSLELPEYKRLSESGPTIFKSHFLPDPQLYVGDSMDKTNFLKDLLSNHPKIYVYRDGRDVLLSLYYYMRTYDANVSELSLSEFLKTKNNFGPPSFHHHSRPAFWKLHLEEWLKAENILPISFESMINDYANTLQKISAFIDLPLYGNIVDVRLKKSSFLSRLATRLKRISSDKIRRTTVLFNEGKPGRFLNYFSKEDLDYFEEETQNILSTLGYD